MRDVKKILEMRSQNFSQRQIAEALKVSRDTVRKVYKELLRPGTNIRLLWEEYADDCRNSNFPFYQYSYFVKSIVTM